MILANLLQGKYDETAREYISLDTTDKNDALRRDNFISGLGGVLGMSTQGGHGGRYTYYGSGKRIVFTLDLLGRFENKDTFLSNVLDQISSQI